MVSGITWCVNERRVSGVAVTRHPIFIVPSLLIDAIDEHRERYLPSEFVLNFSAPLSVEFVLDRLAPLDDRNDVGVVVGVQQVRQVLL